MTDWKTHLITDPLPWLLEPDPENPSVRYFALTDLLDSELRKIIAGGDTFKSIMNILMPLILPGVISGGLFAFITSFDEVVVVLFVGSANQQTLPWQMFTGLREQISPTILAVATILVTLSVILLTTLELMRSRSERLRGMTPG